MASNRKIYNPLSLSGINYAVKNCKKVDISSESAFSYFLQIQYVCVLLTQANEEDVAIDDRFTDRYFKIKEIELTIEDGIIYIDIEATMKNMGITIPNYWNDPQFKNITDYHNLLITDINASDTVPFNAEVLNMTIYDYLRNKIAIFMTDVNNAIGKEYNKVSTKTNKYKEYDTELNKNLEAFNKAFDFKDINDIKGTGIFDQ